MPNSNTSLSSIISNTQFRTIAPSANPLLAAIVAGSTFVMPNFNGANGAASNDPGGLFGWLIYARNYRRNPAAGNSGNSYLLYRTPASLISDLNRLGGLTGITHCLISYTGSGGTYGIFQQTGAKTVETREPIGSDFLHCVNYLAYGGQLLITGSTLGIDAYESIANRRVEILIGNTANQSLCRYLENKPYMAGIFPSAGNGTLTTVPDYASLLSSSNLITGATVADRIFTLYATNGGTYTVSTLVTGGELTYQIPAVADVAGACNQAKAVKQLFVSMAGLDNSKVLNKKITNPIDWSSTLRENLKTNRVNFYVNYNPVFLGSDYVGATGSAVTPTIDERFGPAFLKKTLTKEISQVGIKYLFELNNATTRAAVTREVELILDRYSYAIVRNEAVVTCDETNNSPDYETSLAIDVTIKPLAGTDTFTININLIP